jgi:hypothetical protein
MTFWAEQRRALRMSTVTRKWVNNGRALSDKVNFLHQFHAGRCPRSELWQTYMTLGQLTVICYCNHTWSTAPKNISGNWQCWTGKANSHIPCRSPVALIHTCHATTVPFSGRAESFVKVRVVNGNIRTASLLLVTTFVEYRVVAGRN